MTEKKTYTIIIVDVGEKPLFVADKFLLATKVYLSIPSVEAAHKIAALAEISHYRIIREEGFDKTTVFESPEIAEAAKLNDERVIKINEKRDAAIRELNRLPELYHRRYQFHGHELSVAIRRTEAHRRHRDIPHIACRIEDRVSLRFLSKNKTKKIFDIQLYDYVYERGLVNRTPVLQRKKFIDYVLYVIQLYGGAGTTEEDLTPVLPWIFEKGEELNNAINEIKEKHLGGEV